MPYRHEETANSLTPLKPPLREKPQPRIVPSEHDLLPLPLQLSNPRVDVLQYRRRDGFFSNVEDCVEEGWVGTGREGFETREGDGGGLGNGGVGEGVAGGDDAVKEIISAEGGKRRGKKSKEKEESGRLSEGEIRFGTEEEVAARQSKRLSKKQEATKPK
jgi:hypothetical protein